MSTLDIKCVAVGEGAVGKFCLVRTYINGTFPEDSWPIVVEHFTTSVRVDGHVINLNLVVTAGQEDYDRLRPLSYPQTDVVLLCFALDSPSSYENVMEKWYPEIKHFCPSAPIILVGTRLDRRNEIIQCEGENKRKVITTNQGLALKKKIGARKYVECSALTGERVQRVFDEAVRAVIEPDPAIF